MRHPAIVAALGAALGLAAACERREARPDAPPQVPPPSERTALPEGSAFVFADDDTPEGFAQRMVMGDLFVVQSARLALQRARSPAVREFAQAMAAAHAASSQELKALLAAQKLSTNLPTTLDMDRQRRLNDLTAADPAAFERVYLDQQIAAHQAALDELDDAAEAGAPTALKAWAARAAPVEREHLEQARKLDRQGADRTRTPGAEALPN